MKIGIQTWGTRGDIRPFIALAEGLQAHGHEVTLIITCVDSDRYNHYISKNGVKVKAVASPVIKDPAQWAKLSVLLSARNPLKQFNLIIANLFLPAENEMYAAAKSLCMENDLVIGHFLHYPLQIAAEICKVPFVNVILAHITLASIDYPPQGFPNLGGRANLFLWKLAEIVINLSNKKFQNKMREEKGLKPAKDFLNTPKNCESLNIVAVSNAMCPRPANWPESFQISGFLNMEEESDKEKIHPDLETFLNNGDAPVFMSFGSLMPLDPKALKKTIELFSESARIANCRAIIQAPSFEHGDVPESRNIFYVKETSHSKVFPRCMAIVHHGGAGTTQTASQAGIPSVVVYHISEQEFWGRQLMRLGIAKGVFSRKKVTPQKLAASIRAIADSSLFRERAEKIGAMMRKENGVENAVELINSRFSKKA